MPLKLSHVVAGFVAVLVGYTSSVAIIFQAAESLGASGVEANSWMLALGLGMGISGLLLSIRFRMPILTAWSTPGAALLAFGTEGVTLAEATGAFLFCALLLILTGVTGWFNRLTRMIPAPLASAMLAGILFRFGLGIFTSIPERPALVLSMCTLYLIGKRWFGRFTIPAVLAWGIAFAIFTGAIAPGSLPPLELAKPEFVMPAWSLQVLLGVGLPLWIVTMTSQNMPGTVVLREAGYTPPVNAALTVTGLTTLILAPFGGYAFNLAAITMAICTGPDADPNPTTRYRAAIVAGILYCLVGLFGATVVSLFQIAPRELVLTISGLALLGAIASSLNTAISDTQSREPALITFMTTASGLTLFNIGAPFWGLVFGLVAAALLRARH